MTEPPTGLTLSEIVVAVRLRRRELGLSQTELASMVGVSRAWVAAFEGEAGGANVRAVLRLLDVLGLPLVFVAASVGDHPAGPDSDPTGAGLATELAAGAWFRR